MGQTLEGCRLGHFCKKFLSSLLLMINNFCLALDSRRSFRFLKKINSIPAKCRRKMKSLMAMNPIFMNILPRSGD